MEKVKVEGSKKDKKVFLYTLSTCGWCKKTKDFLKENNIEYEYIDVDKCSRDEQKKIIQELRDKKVPAAFPIIIIDDRTISGFKEKQLSKELDL
jgi:glutaredoxin